MKEGFILPPHVVAECYMVWLNLQRSTPAIVKEWNCNTSHLVFIASLSHINEDQKMKLFPFAAIACVFGCQSFAASAGTADDLMSENIAKYRTPNSAGQWENRWMQLASADVALPNVISSNATGDSNPAVKVVLDNEKVKVTEVTWKPGQKSIENYAEYRVVRVLSGGTLLRTYSDGKAEKMVRSAGEVYVQEPSRPYAELNIGKSDISFSNVQVK
jgi:hypothetical protein